MRKMSSLFIAMMLLLAAETVPALTKPPAEALAKAIADEIPAYWLVTDVVVTASVNTGDAVEPNIRQRFEAMVSPPRRLYVKDQSAAEAFAPYTPILPTVGAKAARTLYGIAQSTYSAGQWKTSIELENQVAELGVPRDLIAGPTVIRGGKEEAKVLERLRPDVAQQVKRQLQAQLEVLKAEHEAQLRALEAEQAKSVDALKARYADQKRQYKAQLKDLKAGHEATVARVERQHQPRLEALKASQQADIEHLKSAHQAALKTLKAEHERRLARLSQKHEAGLEGIKLAFEQEAEALRQRIQNTGKLIALEKTARKKEAELAAAHQATLDARRERTQALLAEFRSAITTEDPDKRWTAFRAAITSDSELLRATALRVALTGGAKGSAIRNRALELALSSGNPELTDAVLPNALTSADPALVSAALPLALASDDTALVTNALKIIFSNAGSLQMQSVRYDGEKYADGRLTLKKIKVNEKNNKVTTILGGSSGDLSNCGQATGTIAFGELVLSSEICQVAITSNDGGRLVGHAVDDDGNPWMVKN